jgi:hypothetical protein
MTIMYAKNYHNIPFLAFGFAWKPSIQAFFVGKNAAEITNEQADDSSLGEPSNTGKY